MLGRADVPQLAKVAGASITPPVAAVQPLAGRGIPLWMISPMYRISPDGQQPIIDVATVEAIEHAIRLFKSGRYHVDEISADTLPSGHTSRRWGIGIKRADGSVALEPDPWEA